MHAFDGQTDGRTHIMSTAIARSNKIIMRAENRGNEEKGRTNERWTVINRTYCRFMALNAPLTKQPIDRQLVGY